MDVELTTQQCAKLFEVSTRTILNWSEAGLPQARRNRWNLKACFDWWIENIDTSRIDQDEGMLAIKKAYWSEKSIGEQLKNQKTRGELISLEDVVQEWAGRVSIVTSGLEAFADRLPPILEGKPRKEMRDIIKKEVRYLRESYARKGKYCPPPKSGALPATSAKK